MIRSFAALAALLPLPALADGCLEEIRAMYLEPGGVFDPAGDIPHEETTITRAPDGSETPVVDVRWQAVDQVISAFPGGSFMLLWGQDFYQGSGWDGPWTDTGQDHPYEGDAFMREMYANAVDTITDPVCDGVVSREGRDLIRYAYRIRTEPPGGQSWWEADQVVYVDQESGRKVITEEHNLMESWAPDPKDSVRITTVTYGAEFSITPPTPE